MTTEHETDAPIVSEERLMVLKMAPRNADVNDVEDLCCEVERLQNRLLAADAKLSACMEEIVSLSAEVVSLRNKLNEPVGKYIERMVDMRARVPTGTELAMDKAPTIGEALERMGWQIVPKEPTEKMTGEGWSLFGITPVRTSEIYKAMLAAAPKPEQPTRPVATHPAQYRECKHKYPADRE